MRLLIATTNPHKLREIGEVLGATRPELISLAALPAVAEPEETGSTFEANARLKAAFYDDHLRSSRPDLVDGTLTVAEDSGLVVDALGGEPGIYSARFVRSDATYDERFAVIHRRLLSQPRPWTARFVCALCAVSRGAVVFETRGTIEGLIAEHASGAAGFGYDPIFYFPPFGATLAEVPESKKLEVAHRGHAFRAFARWLSEQHPY